MNRVFDVAPPDAGTWLYVFAAGLALLLLVEAEKALARWRAPGRAVNR